MITEQEDSAVAVNQLDGSDVVAERVAAVINQLDSPEIVAEREATATVTNQLDGPEIEAEKEEPRTKKAALERLRNMKFAAKDPFKDNPPKERPTFVHSRPRKSAGSPDETRKRKSNRDEDYPSRRRRRSRSRDRARAEENLKASQIESRHQRSTMFFLQNGQQRAAACSQQQQMSHLNRATVPLPTIPIRERIEALLAKPDSAVLTLPTPTLRALVARGVELFREQEQFLSARRAHLIDLDTSISKEREEIDRISKELPPPYRPPLIDELVGSRQDEQQQQQTLLLQQQQQQAVQIQQPPSSESQLQQQQPTQNQQQNQQQQIIVETQQQPQQSVATIGTISTTPAANTSVAVTSLSLPNFSVPPPSVGIQGLVGVSGGGGQDGFVVVRTVSPNKLPLLPFTSAPPPPIIPVASSAASAPSHFSTTPSLLFTPPHPAILQQLAPVVSASITAQELAPSISVSLPNTSIPPPNLLASAAQSNTSTTPELSLNKLSQIVPPSMTSNFSVPPPQILKQPEQQPPLQNLQQLQPPIVSSSLPSLLSQPPPQILKQPEQQPPPNQQQQQPPPAVSSANLPSLLSISVDIGRKLYGDAKMNSVLGRRTTNSPDLINQNTNRK